MRAVLQRVKESKVTVGGQVVGEISSGWLVFLGIHKDDGEKDLEYLVQKTLHLRAFPKDDQAFDISVLEAQKDILVVSQFTLYGDCRKGRRPSFSDSASPDQAKSLYESFVSKIKESGLNVQTGQFQATMDVQLVNDGPVTLLLDSQKIM